ncbi:LysR family transcriptional regulator [Pseudarthrobacter raffinosi]|uniref:LysR family transcriptional regulator n=1 Tax=Pseudarthrobacter raffinosi TaxID=2953651 RepID=UPI00208E46AC|nr:LysR family transcriptional regulator [Pseudarthrobacter sp. MDT3-9]MCO4253542.1 LysR family transcriptional regulator [Pseudarthrobacter sp. MDT3-9]
MSIINETNLRKVDLNLLVVFHVLMQERHVTRAAAKLYVTQGAVSAALGRLRLIFDDPLFQKSRSGMVPTAKALALAPRIGQSLKLVSDLVFEDEKFEPTTSNRTFHIAMSDDLEAVFVPKIVTEAIRSSWNVKFSFHQTNSLLWQEALDDPRMDLVICATPPQVPAAYQHSVLFASSYSCLYDGRRMKLSDPLSLEDYANSGHLRVSYDAQRGFVDEILETQGYERKAVASISHFAGAVAVLRTADLIATIPTYTAKAFSDAAGLTMSHPPIPVPRFTISLLWEVPKETQPEHAWLRKMVEACADLDFPSAPVAIDATSKELHETATTRNSSHP